MQNFTFSGIYLGFYYDSTSFQDKKKVFPEIICFFFVCCKHNPQFTLIKNINMERHSNLEFFLFVDFFIGGQRCWILFQLIIGFVISSKGQCYGVISTSTFVCQFCFLLMFWFVLKDINCLCLGDDRSIAVCTD